ncbi:MAG TPA: hypothetical protein VN229_20255 [Terriglobales bacterium]|nr:hypothetical protein [Terriglobales bacterium]
MLAVGLPAIDGFIDNAIEQIPPDKPAISSIEDDTSVAKTIPRFSPFQMLRLSAYFLGTPVRACVSATAPKLSRSC